MADDATRLMLEIVDSNEVRVRTEKRAILLVRAQTRETEKRVCNVVRTFGRQEIPMMLASMLVDKRNPTLTESLKLLNLLRIDDVSDKASDHMPQEPAELLGGFAS